MKTEKTIFIIDDTQVYNKFMKIHLAELGGYRVEAFEDGERALRKLMSQDDIYAVILDHNLSIDPDKHGLYYLGEIRRLKPDLPVLYATGDESLTIRAEALQAGARKVLLKSPTFLKELRLALDEIENRPKKLFLKFFGKDLGIRNNK